MTSVIVKIKENKTGSILVKDSNGNIEIPLEIYRKLVALELSSAAYKD